MRFPSTSPARFGAHADVHRYATPSSSRWAWGGFRSAGRSGTTAPRSGVQSGLRDPSVDWQAAAVDIADMPARRTRLPSGGARAIVDAFGDLDGVGDHSGFAADPCVALVTAAHSALPMRPVVSAPSTHPDLGGRRAAAGRFGYRIT